MGDKKLRDTIFRWCIPFLIFVVIAVHMMAHFLTVTYDKEQSEVSQQLIHSTEGYAEKLQSELNALLAAGETVARAAGRYTYRDEEAGLILLDALAENQTGYMTVLCKATGGGLLQKSGESEQQAVNLAEYVYYEHIRTTEEEFVFVSDDGVTGNRALVCVTPVIAKNLKAGYFLQYYDVNRFEKLIDRADSDPNAVYYLISGQGSVMAAIGNEHSEIYSKEINLWKNLKNLGADADSLSDMQVRVQAKYSGMTKLTLNGEGYQLTYAPVGVSDWSVVMAVTEDYEEKLLRREWKYTKNMTRNLIILMLVFSTVVVVVNIILKVRDKEKRQKLEEKADTDLLTELNNKLATERKIKGYMAECPDRQALMFILDIDNFKKINDTMGHAFGDEVLRTIGLKIVAEFRATDIIGRTGGDEFIVFLKGIHDDAEMQNQANRLIRFFHNLQVGEYVKYSPTASIGAAVFPKDAKDFEGLYKAADHALYTSKRRGKNQLTFYGDED